MADLAFVTTNGGKYREVREILGKSGHKVRWIRRALPEPQAETLVRVVRAKLEAAEGIPGYVLVEDSGLFIESLSGFPGVYSSHIYRIWGFPQILQLLRRRSRGAYYRTVVGLRRGKNRWFFEGTCPGVVAGRRKGSGGFGFDPIFRPNGSKRTFAEMTTEEKNEISHRSRALASVARFLQRIDPIVR